MKKKSEVLYIIISIIVCGLFLLWAFDDGLTKEEKEFGNKLVEVVKNNVNNKEKVLDLTEVADLDWDTVYIFKPYASNEYIEKTIGTELNYYSAVEWQDVYVLFVFMKDSKVVFQVDMTTGRGSFLMDELYLSLKRNEAKFEIITTKYDNSYYENYYVDFKPLFGKTKTQNNEKNKNTRD